MLSIVVMDMGKAKHFIGGKKEWRKNSAQNTHTNCTEANKNLVCMRDSLSLSLCMVDAQGKQCKLNAKKMTAK